MEYTLAILEGPATYAGWGAHYIPETPPGSGILEQVFVGPIYRPQHGAEVPRLKLGVRPHARPVSPRMTPPRPVLEGATLRLVYEAPAPLPGLRGWFLQG